MCDLKLPDVTLPDGSMLVDRVLVEREAITRGPKNEIVERKPYGYVISTYRPAAHPDALQRAEAG